MSTDADLFVDEREILRRRAARHGLGYKRTGGSKKDRCFRVLLRIPDGADEDQVMDYIENAVCGWKGGLHPDDPMTNLDCDTVLVKRRHPKYGEQR